MAKKNHPKCDNPRCLNCRLWPKMIRQLGKEQACYWVDRLTGELFVATGLRVTPEGDCVDIPDDQGAGFYEVDCDCGAVGPIREDILDRGFMDCCPRCAALMAQIARN